MQQATGAPLSRLQGNRLLTPEDAARADRFAERAGIAPVRLMENAGRASARAIIARWPERTCRPLVLCGPGNNGGDGFVIARFMRAAGYNVHLAAMGEGGSEARRAAMAEWVAAGGSVAPMDANAVCMEMARSGLLVDALFGAGLDRDLSGEIAGIVRHARQIEIPVASIDMPSGLCGRTGKIRGSAFRAALTITFEREKIGHMLDAAATLCGALTVVPIGIPESAFEESEGAGTHRNDPAIWRFSLEKAPDAHKYAHGSALVCAGRAGACGAARLAARAALRVGAGLVTLLCEPAAMAENAAHLDAIMLARVSEGKDFAAILADSRHRALLAGPGFGLGRARRALLDAILRHTPCNEGRVLVLDADALTQYADSPSRLFSLIEGKDSLLTPHRGEFARLFPALAARLGEDVTFSKADAAREAARLSGSCVLFKGHDTVIAAPDGRCVVESACRERAAPWLATAGAGDVLAGLATGLAARGAGAFEAGCIAAWLQVEAARAFGPGLIAEDLPEGLPAVLRRLLGKRAVLRRESRRERG